MTMEGAVSNERSVRGNVEPYVQQLASTRDTNRFAKSLLLWAQSWGGQSSDVMLGSSFPHLAPPATETNDLAPASAPSGGPWRCWISLGPQDTRSSWPHREPRFFCVKRRETAQRMLRPQLLHVASAVSHRS